MDTTQLVKELRKIEETLICILDILPVPDRNTQYIRETLLQMLEESYGK